MLLWLRDYVSSTFVQLPSPDAAQQLYCLIFLQFIQGHLSNMVMLSACFQTLPPELIVNIFGELETLDDASSLSHTSSDLYAISKRYSSEIYLTIFRSMPYYETAAHLLELQLGSDKARCLDQQQRKEKLKANQSAVNFLIAYLEYYNRDTIKTPSRGFSSSRPDSVSPSVFADIHARLSNLYYDIWSLALMTNGSARIKLSNHRRRHVARLSWLNFVLATSKEWQFGCPPAIIAILPDKGQWYHVRDCLHEYANVVEREIRRDGYIFYVDDEPGEAKHIEIEERDQGTSIRFLTGR